MKKRIPQLAIVALLIALCASCTATDPPDRVAFKVLETSRASAVTAMQSFNVYYQAGKATENQRAKALAYYAEYQRLDAIAVRALSAPNPDYHTITESVTPALTSLLSLVADLKKVSP